MAVDGCTPILALQFARDFELEIEKKKEIERERRTRRQTLVASEKERQCARELCVAINIDVLIYLQSYTTPLQSSA